MTRVIVVSMQLFIPVNILNRSTIDSPAKRHLNGITLAGRWWPDTVCWLRLRTWLFHRFIIMIVYLSYKFLPMQLTSKVTKMLKKYHKNVIKTLQIGFKNVLLIKINELSWFTCMWMFTAKCTSLSGDLYCPRRMLKFNHDSATVLQC